MPFDPDLLARVADITGVAAGDAPAANGQAVPTIDIHSSAIDEAPVAVYTVDLTGRVVSWNRAAERLFGWSADEVLGRPPMFLPDDELENALTSLGELLAGTTISEAEYSPVCRDGHRPRVLTSASLLHDDQGRPSAVVTFAIDVTHRFESAAALERAEHKWRALIENISDTVSIVDAEANIIETSGQFTDVLGYEADEWIGRNGFDLFHPEDTDTAASALARVRERPGAEERDVLRIRHASGHYELVEVTARNLLDDPAVRGIVVTSRNVTSVKQAEVLLSDEAAVLELIARDAPLSDTLPAICKTVEYHSGGATALFLLDETRQRLRVGAAGSLPPRLIETVERRRFDPTSSAGQAIERREAVVIPDFSVPPYPDDRYRTLAEHGLRSGWSAPILDNRSGEVLGCVTTLYRDATAPSPHERDVVAVACQLAAIALDRDQAQRELHHQAHHHHLTGLPNRRSLLRVLDAALARARRDHSRLAVMFVDLDRFKMVNDSYGHAAGDSLLVRFGNRLRNLVRPDDYVGHFGADEFVVVLEDIDDIEDVRFVAHRLELALSEPFAFEEGEIFLSASVGVAVSESGQESSDVLLQQADAAMYRAKELGRNRLEVFDREMRTRVVERLRVDRDLRVAIERAELALRYQPEIDLASGRVVGVEALLRWRHPERGEVLPGEFIEIAEDTGLIVRIGRWVIEEAVHQARTWVDRIDGVDDLVIAVNLSPRQLTAPDLVATVDRVLRRHDWPARSLLLEVTESVLVDDAEAALDILGQLKALGVRLALDDFGTGFSSLSYLHRFPVDIVKIDRSFVAPLAADGNGSPIADAVLHMARALAITTCAEGVETPEQLAGLRALGCDWAQGFWFAEPLPSEDVAALLRRAATF
jgi:diguanylate cyclase (GGDEF)-like protein/PAS domain S-box-containing protein